MRRVLLIYFASGIAALVGYETFCWYVDQGSLLRLMLPIVMAIAIGFVILFVFSRRFAQTQHGATMVRVVQIDHWFLRGGLLLNLLFLLWLIVEHVSFINGFRNIDL